MIPNRPRPRTYDHALRWWVPSHTVPGKEYLVELDSYGFNGECQCKDFAVRLEPIVSRGIEPLSALAGGLVEERPGKRPEDALRCHHIIDAMMESSEQFSRAVVAAEEHAAKSLSRK